MVQADAVREAAFKVVDFQDVGEELAQLVGFVGDSVDLIRWPENLFKVVADHRDAASGGCDDIFIVAEDAEEALGEGPGVGVQTDVGHWLAAAGLLGGELDFTAEVLEDP